MKKYSIENIPRPFFSIIIPTYNRSKIVGRAIRSVINQEFSNWELIVIDDGGSDDTEFIVMGFKDPRIRYHRQENKGPSSARNEGIRLAKGLFIGFLDDDDEFLPKHLSTHSAKIYDSDLPLAIFKSGLIVNFENGKSKKERLFNSENETSIQYLFKVQQGIHSFFFHRKVFDTILFDEGFKLFEDEHFLIRTYLKYPLIQVSTHSVIYQKHQTNSTRILNLDEEYFGNYLSAFDDIIDHFGTQLKPHITRSKLANIRQRICLNHGILLIQNGAKDQGLKYILKPISVNQIVINWRYYLRAMYYFLIG